jgi:hypothetical protein
VTLEDAETLKEELEVGGGRYQVARSREPSPGVSPFYVMMLERPRPSRAEYAARRRRGRRLAANVSR